MITREEAKQKLCMNLLCGEASGISWVTDDFVIALIDQVFNDFEQHIKSLEAQLSNTEQLTCDDCQYQTAGDEWGSGCSHNDIYDYYDDGSYTIPTNFYCNRFKPKDTK